MATLKQKTFDWFSCVVFFLGVMLAAYMMLSAIKIHNEERDFIKTCGLKQGVAYRMAAKRDLVCLEAETLKII